MSKNKKNLTAAPQKIWDLFYQKLAAGESFEYECMHDKLGLCVRSTDFGYCPILSKEEALKREQTDENFYGIVDAATGEEFSKDYWYYEYDAGKTKHHFVVRKKAVIS